MSWVPSAVSANPALASRSSIPMVTITDAGIPPTEGWSADLSSLAQASSSASCSRCTWGRWSGMSTTVPSSSSIAVRAGFGQRVQDRVQLGTDGVGESACEMPHAVPALLELQVAAVLLQLVIDGLRPVGVGGIDDGVGEPPQLRRRQDDGVVGEQLLGGLDRFRVEVGRVSLCMARSTMALSPRSPRRRVAAPPVGAAQVPASRRASWSADRRRRRRGSGWRLRRGRAATPGSGIGSMRGGAVLLRQMVGFGVGDQPVIDERLPVAEGFEALPHRDLLLS